MKNEVLLKSVVVGVILFGAVQQACATYIRSAETVWSNTANAVSVVNTSNQSGLISTYVSGVTEFDTYDPGSVNHLYPWGNEWFATEGTNTGALMFDLGGMFTIDRFAFWNEDSGGITSISVSISLDGSSWGASLGTFTPSDNMLDVNYTADVFSFSAITQYVRFDLVALDPTDQGYLPTLAVGEVAFSVLEPVPEPATILLFGVGAGVLGLFGSRKKRH